MDNEIGDLGIPQFDAPITANNSEVRYSDASNLDLQIFSTATV